MSTQEKRGLHSVTIASLHWGSSFDPIRLPQGFSGFLLHPKDKWIGGFESYVNCPWYVGR